MSDAPPPDTGYPPIPALADLLVDDQGDIATKLGVALVTLPDDHMVVIAVRLAMEMRDRALDERTTNLDIAAQLREQGSTRSWVSRAELERRRAEPGPLAPAVPYPGRGAA